MIPFIIIILLLCPFPRGPYAHPLASPYRYRRAVPIRACRRAVLVQLVQAPINARPRFSTELARVRACLFRSFLFHFVTCTRAWHRHRHPQSCPPQKNTARLYTYGPYEDLGTSVS